MERKISLVSMMAGNVIALKRTMESFVNEVDEFVVGDMMVFPEDREVVESYKKDFNIRLIRMPFNYIFHMGFSSTLNFVIANAKNDMVLYSNVSETIDENYGISKLVNENPQCNAFYFSHRVERHRWHRLFDRRHVEWGGLIHEEAINGIKPYHKPVYMMADTEKDMDDPFKAKIFNDLKELNYFRQYVRLVENPSSVGPTNDYWLGFAKDNYDSMIERLNKKGKRYEAFKIGDFKMLMMDYYSNPEFEKERFESSTLLNFQGARKDIL